MDIIKELWYGNISPFEQCTRGDKQLGVYFKLAKNIYLNAKTFTTIGSKNNKFEGIFD